MSSTTVTDSQDLEVFYRALACRKAYDEEPVVCLSRRQVRMTENLVSLVIESSLFGQVEMRVLLTKSSKVIIKGIKKTTATCRERLVRETRNDDVFAHTIPRHVRYNPHQSRAIEYR